MLKKKDDEKLIKRIIRINHPLNINRTNREWNIFSISQHYKFKKKNTKSALVYLQCNY